MDLQQLICSDRLGSEDAGKKTADEGRSEFKRDFDRIIFSPAFRRLHAKTQVFAFPANDMIHNRLTHSLEVYSIGRSLGTRVGILLGGKGNIPDILGDIVGAAGLAHDIGNSPFGHCGEDAFSAYFTSATGKQFIGSYSEQQRADFQRFEGNAVGFRMLTHTKPATSDGSGGLGLTYSTLGAFLKYPTRSNLAGGKSMISEKKHSFFASEEGNVEKVMTRLGCKKHADGKWSRFPLAFLVEAADDIAYLVIDLEDGYRNGLVPYQEAHDILLAIAADHGEPGLEERSSGIHGSASKISFLRAKAINSLVHQAAGRFCNEWEAISAGSFHSELLSGVKSSETIGQLRALSAEVLYNAKEVVMVEVTGHEVLAGLLEIFVTSYFLDPGSPRSKKIQRLIPDQYRFADAAKTKGLHGYDLLVSLCEYICGMTDSYAIDTYRRLRGIELPFTSTGKPFPG